MPAEAICNWLTETPLGIAVRYGYWGYAIPQTVHMLSMVLFSGAVILQDFRALGLVRRPELPELASQLAPVRWLGFAIAFLSGFALFASDALRYYTNPAFRAKVVLLVLIGVNAAVCRAPKKLSAALSLLLWIGVIFASRWIAFEMTMP